MGPAEALLLETFGSRFLSYVGAVDEATLLARLERSGELPALAEGALTGLVPIAERVAEESGTHEHGPPASFFLQMLRFEDETSHGPWNAVRLAAGGGLPSIPDSADDELASVLLQLALVSYPNFLLPNDPNDLIGVRWNVNLFNHPFRPTLVELIGMDDALSRLFPDEDPGLGRRGFVYTNMGHGGTLQSVMLGEMILQAAWDAVSIAHREPAFERFSEEVLRSLSVVRSAARGDDAHVQALLAFTGITTGGEETIETPWASFAR